MEKKSVPVLSNENQESLDKIQTTSQKIRFLNKIGYSKGDITRIMKVHLQRPDFLYQHVRNVLLQEPKKSTTNEKKNWLVGYGYY